MVHTNSSHAIAHPSFCTCGRGDYYDLSIITKAFPKKQLVNDISTSIIKECQVLLSELDGCNWIFKNESYNFQLSVTKSCTRSFQHIEGIGSDLFCFHLEIFGSDTCKEFFIYLPSDLADILHFYNGYGNLIDAVNGSKITYRKAVIVLGLIGCHIL